MDSVIKESIVGGPPPPRNSDIWAEVYKIVCWVADSILPQGPFEIGNTCIQLNVDSVQLHGIYRLTLTMMAGQWEVVYFVPT